MDLATETQMTYQPPVLSAGVKRHVETRAITFSISSLQRQRVRFWLAAKTLARTGIIVVRGAATPEVVATLAGMAETTWNTVSDLAPGQILPNVIINRDQERVLKGYKSLVESNKPVINVRYGEDEGMMDVFHPEHLCPERKQLVIGSLHEALIRKLAEKAFGKALEVKCRNLYLNRGVTNTRFYHSDGERIKVKSFVYLDDVGSLDIGPYCYIKNSHRDGRLRRHNQSFNDKHGLNKHEYRLLSGRAALPIFCRAGDMVVSAQHGAHRGHPQMPSAHRAVLVNVYEPTKGKD